MLDEDGCGSLIGLCASVTTLAEAIASGELAPTWFEAARTDLGGLVRMKE